MSNSNEGSKFRPLGFVIVSGLAVALATTLTLRPLPEARAELEVVGESEIAVADAARNEAVAAPSSEAAATGQVAPSPVLAPERPLRVTALGWELLGPAVIANDGLTPGAASQFQQAGLAVELTIAKTSEELAAQLARGGGSKEGADVALLPLPTFVASYEQLRALAPEVFFVIGWSNGRDALATERSKLLTEGTSASQIALVGAPGQPATLLGLFALEQAGVDLDHVELIPAHDDRAKHATLRAVERTQANIVDARDLVLTSADAPRLIPMVAVAPAGFVHGNTDALARFTRVWLSGVEQLGADVPDAARRIAAQPGAPEAVALLERMGYVSFADLADAVHLAGLSGRGAVSLESLFQRTWSLWREVGVLSTPAPEHAPLDNLVLASVALGEGAPVVLGHAQPRRAGERLVLVHCVPPDAALDQEALVDEIGFLAGSFVRAEIELSVRRDKQAPRRDRQIIAEAIERYDLDANHVRTGPRIRKGELACIRVLAP